MDMVWVKNFMIFISIETLNCHTTQGEAKAWKNDHNSENYYLSAQEDYILSQGQ